MGAVYTGGYYFVVDIAENSIRIWPKGHIVMVQKKCILTFVSLVINNFSSIDDP